MLEPDGTPVEEMLPKNIKIRVNVKFDSVDSRVNFPPKEMSEFKKTTLIQRQQVGNSPQPWECIEDRVAATDWITFDVEDRIRICLVFMQPPRMSGRDGDWQRTAFRAQIIDTVEKSLARDKAEWEKPTNQPLSLGTDADWA